MDNLLDCVLNMLAVVLCVTLSIQVSACSWQTFSVAHLWML